MNPFARFAVAALAVIVIVGGGASTCSRPATRRVGGPPAAAHRRRVGARHRPAPRDRRRPTGRPTPRAGSPTRSTIPADWVVTPATSDWPVEDPHPGWQDLSTSSVSTPRQQGLGVRHRSPITDRRPGRGRLSWIDHQCPADAELVDRHDDHARWRDGRGRSDYLSASASTTAIEIVRAPMTASLSRSTSFCRPPPGRRRDRAIIRPVPRVVPLRRTGRHLDARRGLTVDRTTVSLRVHESRDWPRGLSSRPIRPGSSSRRPCAQHDGGDPSLAGCSRPAEPT